MGVVGDAKVVYVVLTLSPSFYSTATVSTPSVRTYDTNLWLPALFSASTRYRGPAHRQHVYALLGMLS